MVPTHLKQLIRNINTQQKQFDIQGYHVLSQDPTILAASLHPVVRDKYLPQFIQFWKDLERATGYRWKNTSYIRDSPSHKIGHAFDLAPDVASSAQQHYAVYRGSDPVLYKRLPLIAKLQTMRNLDYSNGQNKLGVFIEPDHLHVQVMSSQGGGDYPINVASWKIPKPIYADTNERMNLPVFTH